MGSLLDNGKFSQGLLKLQLYYFSPLLNIKRFRLRNFLSLDVYSTVTKDVNKSLGFGNEITGFDDDIKGQSILTLKYETVLFTPWYLLGFRFAPYFHSDMGIVSQYTDVFKPNDVYYSLGIGIRIRNETLAYNTLVIRLSYLPKITSGDNRWNFNVTGSTPGLYSDIEIRKPTVVNNNIIIGF